MKHFDAIVIGGGPAGMTAALYLLRSQAKVALVEKLSTGGQLLLTERIDNYPGFPEGLLGYELADKLNEHVNMWASDTLERFGDEVRAIEVGERVHKVKIGDEWIEGKTIIICTGSRYKNLGLPGEQEFTGKGVSYCALCDGNFFRDQVVAVVGGGNTALEEALYLSRLVKKLYLIHRRDDFRATKCYQNKCFINPKIQVVRSTVVEEITGDQLVSGLTLRNVKTQEQSKLDVDGVFIFVGFDPVACFRPEQLDVDSKGFVLTDLEMRTNIDGIFAAGDIRSKTCRQVATAVGDGATAANSALSYLENYE